MILEANRAIDQKSIAQEQWDRFINHETVVNLIANTTTSKGYRYETEIDTSIYPIGIKVSDDEFNKINLHKDDFHGEWNYYILPTLNE